MNNRRPIKDKAQLIEVDPPFAQDAITLFVIPTNGANLRKQRLKFFRHSKAPADGGCGLALFDACLDP